MSQWRKSSSQQLGTIDRMKREAAEILKDALELPTEARAALAGSLLDSLDTEVDEEAEAAWATEVNRRVAELDSGALKTMVHTGPTLGRARPCFVASAEARPREAEPWLRQRPHAADRTATTMVDRYRLAVCAETQTSVAHAFGALTCDAGLTETGIAHAPEAAVGEWAIH